MQESSDGAHAPAQGIQRDRVRKGKKVLPVDFKFEDGPCEEDEPGDVISRVAQARPDSLALHSSLAGYCNVLHTAKPAKEGRWCVSFVSLRLTTSPFKGVQRCTRERLGLVSLVQSSMLCNICVSSLQL